ncbi:hypothetical protein HOO31_04775 [Aliarcobacter cryaerophilus]|uniref:hypothetical protein n=1 Tax=Aliarcobacter cryaerophilus TaxID=28198 RepID=UPI00164BCFCD|nr:hypothetical protein [Aliarcobacter cryaerophilus]QNK85924.1 hypothetical protein HOO31_04775 [Aliarcobacter cryaerophilus]
MLKKLNLGQIYETIVLDKKACQIIDSKSDNDFCTLENIKLVWKFGDTYVFDKQNNPDSKSYIRYEIPKSSIIMTNKVFDYKRELNILKEKEENINKKIKNQVDKTEISKLEKDKTTITTKIKIIEEKERIKKLKQLISEREKLEQLISEREKLEREINEQ